MEPSHGNCRRRIRVFIISVRCRKTASICRGRLTFPINFNGVEADASKLAGASGLVEVNVKATPNEKAKAYYKNNMVLTVLVPVDMEKCYSVDAPGAQVQSVGSYQAAMFAALPGRGRRFYSPGRHG